ncbi:glycosyltransferase family 2 protein [Paenibacillus apiarius]|uniref:glycosyltransferase family 2 protein n=1 Tax=Paenibacillus apiarius TaxID=46240 RepID=UPI00197F022F|nr:glycosyltransferase family 2 protein [Paenibacillus apiarius]MBN3525574.1 glycosyltransferase family 2 protein [Paenibacillus apiarius]
MARKRRSVRRMQLRRRRSESYPEQMSEQQSKHERHEQGYSVGYAEGLRAGQEQYGVPFEGTSIIIPTYNKAELLEQCIASIQKHTKVPYEIIVVDNASTDSTPQYLYRHTGQIRFHIHEINRGFSGAINTGLMMAKGRTICLLNNDILVTPNWLSNLLNCLDSDTSIGMVGPVTNYISGEQQIPVPYEKIEDMYTFGAKHNVPNAGKWQGIDRLVGFCLLFRRELFEATGFFDEGFEIGNFEDEDYIVRVRLNRRKLVIARDTFIHHFGSASMKALGDKFQEVNNRNAAFFSKKWGNPYDWIHRVRERNNGAPAERNHAYYPTHVAVTGLTETVYWIEHGTKYPIQGKLNIPVVRVSQLDLRGWATGPAMNAATVIHKWNERSAADGTIPDGGVFTTETGRWYQRQGDSYRELMSEHAVDRWQLNGKMTVRTEKERQSLKEGLPIMAAPVIQAYHL